MDVTIEFKDWQRDRHQNVYAVRRQEGTDFLAVEYPPEQGKAVWYPMDLIQRVTITKMQEGQD